MSGKCKIYWGLWPFSVLFGIGVRVRNLLFDVGWLHEERFPLPVICIGNLTVGGTGKTPHTEYLIRLLQNSFRLAVLSRGYKRKSKGFVLASSTSRMEDIGDEPYQMARKFPAIHVAVDGDRCRGIRQLTSPQGAPDTEVILLDDAFQHRYVAPTLNILLTDCHRLYTQDKLLPAGRLREPVDGARRADVIIVTKCESYIQPIDFRIIEEDIHLSAYQELYFSRILYGELEPVFSGKAPRRTLKGLASTTEVLLVSGIASPAPLEKEIHKYTEHVTSLVFPDHHAFDRHDIQKIQTAFKRLTSTSKLIIITEKDAARLRDLPSLPMEWFSHLYCLPITVGFCMDREKQFQELIVKHIDTRIKNHPILR